jgi:hypothetical protein
MRLCVGDDWAEDHHDIEVMDEVGQVLATRRLPEGVAGIGQLHERIGRFAPADGTWKCGPGSRAAAAVGGGANRRRLHGVPGEPAAEVPVPGPTRRVPGQERRRRRTCWPM